MKQKRVIFLLLLENKASKCHGGDVILGSIYGTKFQTLICSETGCSAPLVFVGTVGHELDLASLVHVQGIHYALESNRNCQIDVSLLQEEEKKIRSLFNLTQVTLSTEIYIMGTHKT
ncbi:hypothetical protein ACJX0J_024158, partial [Zea mays]